MFDPVCPRRVLTVSSIFLIFVFLSNIFLASQSYWIQFSISLFISLLTFSHSMICKRMESIYELSSLCSAFRSPLSIWMLQRSSRAVSSSFSTPLRIFQDCLIFLDCYLFLVVNPSSCQLAFLNSFQFLTHSFSNLLILSLNSSIYLFNCSNFLFVLLTISSRFFISDINQITQILHQNDPFQQLLTYLIICYWKIQENELLFQDPSRYLSYLQVVFAIFNFSCQFYSFRL